MPVPAAGLGEVKPRPGEPKLRPWERQALPAGELWRVIQALILVMEGTKALSSGLGNTGQSMKSLYHAAYKQTSQRWTYVDCGVDTREWSTRHISGLPQINAAWR
eukprot:scaffold163770_cov19-Tisochrysis_lutea.AAC.1